MTLVRLQMVVVVIAIGAAMVYTGQAEYKLEQLCSSNQPTDQSCKRF